MATINLSWTDINSGTIQEDGFRLYRSDTPFTSAILPAILVTLPPDTEQYSDTTAPETTVYYMLETYKSGLPNRFTPLITISSASDRLLLESGDALLLENGDNLLLE